jgi:dihydroorotase
MSTLFRKVRIVDPASAVHGQCIDLRIAPDGRIAALGEGLEASAEDLLVEAADLHASPGWFDPYAQFRDPGEEHKEDLESGAAAAAQGGFTAVAVLPDTDPPRDNKSAVAYVRKRAQDLPVALHPYATITQGLKGRELTEMHDLRSAGAIAFAEGHRPIRHAGMLLRALRYTQPMDGLVCSLPLDLDLVGKAVVHEGLEATRLGMAGMPHLAETLQLQRDLSILRYAGGRLHVPLLSSAQSVELLRAAREEGLMVTAGVAAYQLLLDDRELDGYDANVKVMPPLRSQEDREALIDAVCDGTIGAVCSHHAPQHQDDKQVEFEYAGYGIAGLETTYASLRTALGERATPERCCALLGRHARQWYGLPQPRIEAGEAAELTFFQPDKPWTPSPAQSRSKARNNPLYGRTLTGRVYGIFARGQWLPALHTEHDAG